MTSMVDIHTFINSSDCSYGASGYSGSFNTCILAIVVWFIGKQSGKKSPKKHHCSLRYHLLIRLQARVLGYSQRPSVTKDRLWLQASDLLLTLYHSFPLFPKPPVFSTKTGGFDIFERLYFVYSSVFLELEFHIAYAFNAAISRALRYLP